MPLGLRSTLITALPILNNILFLPAQIELSGVLEDGSSDGFPLPAFLRIPDFGVTSDLRYQFLSLGITPRVNPDIVVGVRVSLIGLVHQRASDIQIELQHIAEDGHESKVVLLPLSTNTVFSLSPNQVT